MPKSSQKTSTTPWYQHPKFKKIISSTPQYLGIITILLAAVAVITLFIGGVLPALWLAILVILGGFGLWLTLKPLFSKKTPPKRLIAPAIFAVVISIISIAVASFNISVMNFLRGIQEGEYQTVTYSIIAEKDRSMTTEKAKTAGLVHTDPYLEESKKELKNHTKADPKDYPTTKAAMEDLKADTIDTTVLNTANVQLAKESYEDFDQNFEVIATFTIKVKGATATKDNADASKPFALYISGIDTYGEISAVSRSDVNMLAVANPTTRNLLLINTPRDYYVQLHGTTGTKDKLTHAGVYGIDMSRQTLEDLYGIEIPYYIRINFSSLVTIVDAVGGVDVYSDRAFKSFHEGQNHLNGKDALAFSRERYSFSEGDRQRGRNQQRVIEALVNKLSTPGALANYQSILGAAQGAIQTNLPPSFITSLANKQVSDAKRWTTRSMSVDGTGSMGPTYSMGAQPLYIMIPDETSLNSARTAAQQQLK
ncbi:LCP family protein [Candidatus Saccharibacteria bacterium TM7i]|nr:LCP family protein [Candidatus Saccharibacteria bacterium TM7i]